MHSWSLPRDLVGNPGPHPKAAAGGIREMDGYINFKDTIN